MKNITTASASAATANSQTINAGQHSSVLQGKSSSVKKTTAKVAGQERSAGAAAISTSPINGSNLQ